MADRVEVDVLPEKDAVAFLVRRSPALANDRETASALAAELGCLPLALEQAASFLEQSNLPPVTYLERFRNRREQMLAAGEDLAYAGTVDTVWALTLERLARESPAAATMLELCAFCAPEPIPLTLFTDNVTLLPERLRGAISDDPMVRLDGVVNAVLGYSLARRHGQTVLLHRLVQAVVASHLPPDRRAAYADTVSRLLEAASPGKPDEPATWPRWGALGPHLLYAAAGVGADDLYRLRAHADQFCRHMIARGDYTGARWVAEDLHRRSIAIHGPNHPDTLTAEHTLAVSVYFEGGQQRAQEMAEAVLARRRRVLGDDHIDTLSSANILSRILADMGDYELP